MYRPNYVGAPVDGSARTTPVGYRRVVRGGSFTRMVSNIRTRYRGSKTTNERRTYVGIRVARSKP